MNTRDINLSKEINKEATTRQLYRFYREGVKHLNDVTEHYNTGSEWHLGENIRRVLRIGRQELDITIAELKERNIDPATIKNVPELIAKKSSKELVEDNAAKSKAALPASNESSAFDKWYNKEVTGLGSFDTALFELFILASEANRARLIIAFPQKFTNLKFGL